MFSTFLTDDRGSKKAASTMNEALIIAARRTPIVRSNKEFAQLGAEDLLAKFLTRCSKIQA